VTWFGEKALEALGIETGSCGLKVSRLADARTPEEAWALLPPDAEGWICFPDQVERAWPGGSRAGPFLSAEVVLGQRSVSVRMEGAVWRAWQVEELPGDDHRWVRERFVSSRTKEGTEMLCYATYWRRVMDGGIAVWTPVISRFCGWEG
jgi:hypothetical protein